MLLDTTCAVTMASGSSQANLLPVRASAVMNCRVLEGDTAESLLAHFRSLLPEGVQIRLLHGSDPSPARSLGGRCLKLMEEIEQERSGNRSVMIPGLLAGGTDSRYYTAVRASDGALQHPTRPDAVKRQKREPPPLNRQRFGSRSGASSKGR